MPAFPDPHPNIPPVTTAHVLVVEDEPKIAGLLSDYLHRDHYTVSLLDSGQPVMDRLRAAPPNLILLDIMLPDMDGMRLCREIRQISTVPIIMLTARIEEADRLRGFELGADDYVCKPFSPREVMARVRALLRRAGQEPIPSTMSTGDTRGLHLEPTCHRAVFNGRELTLTPVEFRLLQQFHGHPNTVLSRENLLDSLYDDHRVVTARTVDSHIKNLRRKLQAVAPGHRLIQAVYGVGYRFTSLAP
ncbi:response regulator [Ectothiorhodospira lacustris]|uniref:response regulator n=1 Tax=Ectothiorhodospira lacustris TaxID=2899127 RepID=UPI001EE8F5E0|nr:response regulator [Ectothiorhodospira lacustris]MCG5509117.1 response regulator [Ectothiorhodospira lacustris]MCG5520908.1 response regulator [Ectothiorhodospira lacustris]